MAFTTPKQLGDLLQEQQEPFILEIYLLERGYSKTKMNSEHGLRCCCCNSNKFLKRSASCGVSKSRKVVPNCSKIVKAAYDRLVSISMRMKNLEARDQNINVCIQETAKEDRFSSARSTTVFNSCSSSDGEDVNVSTPKCSTCQASKHGNLLNEGEVTIDRDAQQRRCVDERKQPSPVSVLGYTVSDENLPINNTQHSLKTRIEETSTISNISATSLDQSWKEKPRYTNGCEARDLVTSDPPSQYMKIKMALQQTKQLLFDCVREVVETHGWKNTTRQSFHKFLGPDEIGKLLCENVLTWSKQSMDGNNTTQLLDFDLSISALEWSDFKHQKKEVCIDIGDAILEVLTKEIVIDMNHTCTQRYM